MCHNLTCRGLKMKKKTLRYIFTFIINVLFPWKQFLLGNIKHYIFLKTANIFLPCYILSNRHLIMLLIYHCRFS